MDKSTMRKIRVNNYTGDPLFKENRSPVEFADVDAWCVSGSEGIFAFFYYDKYLCMAAGDDGHWWLLTYMDGHWTKEFKRTVAEIEDTH
jgi:hypothetical protein